MEVKTSIKFGNDKHEFTANVENLTEAVETFGPEAAEYYYEKGVQQRFSTLVRNAFDKDTDSEQEAIEKINEVVSGFQPVLPQRGKSDLEKARELLSGLSEEERQALLS